MRLCKIAGSVKLLGGIGAVVLLGLSSFSRTAGGEMPQGTTAKSPAPIVTAPAASDLPRKERRLKEPFDGLIVSVALLISVSRSTLLSRFRSTILLPV